MNEIYQRFLFVITSAKTKLTLYLHLLKPYLSLSTQISAKEKETKKRRKKGEHSIKTVTRK